LIMKGAERVWRGVNSTMLLGRRYFEHWRKKFAAEGK